MTVPLRVLLVEDDTDLREALCDAMSDAGHTVETAADGVEGLRQLRATRPDVVVLDLMMPKLDGWQFRLAQRQDPMIATTPVVAISASNSPTAAAVDADLFLRKPLDAGELNKAIEDVFAAHIKRLEPARIAETDRLATLGMLTASLAHEINNPLTYLLIELAQLEKQLPELAETADRVRVDELVGHARDALHGAQRIRGIMAAVRTFARVDETTRKPVDVRVPVEAALHLVGNALRHRARVVTKLDEAPLLLGNEGRLGQVILNLLTNAMHALADSNAEDHEVRVTTGVDEAGDIVVEVADTGPGIPPHVLEHVFEPFFSTKPVGHGTGLGLSISRSIIAAHGGTIDVHSEPGRGATFRIVLPAHVRS